jgi:hypothetical protein
MDRDAFSWRVSLLSSSIEMAWGGQDGMPNGLMMV